MVRIRPERLEDIPAIDAVITSAFGRDNEARLVAQVRQSPGFDPQRSLVAEDGDDVVGHILFVPIQVETPNHDAYDALALAPLAVHPDRQSQGIGSALCRAGIECCRDSEFKSIIVLGHPQYYPRLGFVPAERFGVSAPFATDPGAFMILSLDNRAHPQPGVVRYPRAFDEF